MRVFYNRTNKTYFPYLLEVNHTPSFATDTPFDLKIKSLLIHDTIKMLNLTLKRKQKFFVSQKV